MPRLIFSSLLLLTVAITAGGCASAKSEADKKDSAEPLIIKEGFNPSWSTDDTIVVDQTDILGTSKSGQDTPGLFDSFFESGVDAESQRKIEEAETRINRLEKQLALQQAQGVQSSARARPRANTLAQSNIPRQGVAVLFADALDTNDVETSLLNTISGAASDFPLFLIDAALVEDQLRAEGCAVTQPQSCATALQQFPGVRMLMLVRGSTSGDTAQLSVTHIDVLLNRTLGPTAFSVQLTEQGPLPSSMLAVADAMLFRATNQMGLAPWQARMVSADDGEIVINVGAAAGVKEGTRLGVHNGAKTIRTANGTVAGWLPGEEIGELEVISVRTDYLAVARLVGGQAPRSEDPLLLKTDRP